MNITPEAKPQISQQLEIVFKIAAAAATAILEVYRQADLGVEAKADNSPITEADKRAHRIIVGELKKHFSLPVLSEEDVIDFETRRNWKEYWLVDPLDGTKDFIAKNGEFTVNIALVRDGRPVLGVVAIPALGIAYGAERGKGAFKVEGEKIKRIRHESTRTDLICAESRFHASPKTEKFCKKNGITKVVKSGSAIKLCKVAEGEIDVYPRFNPTMEWDMAAAHVILNEAGCELFVMETGKPLRYNREDLRNPSLFVCANRFRFEQFQF